jgi:hypothetical protein
MQGIVVWIAFMVGMIGVYFLPLPPWGKLLVGSLYGAAIGWGITRWNWKKR